MSINPETGYQFEAETNKNDTVSSWLTSLKERISNLWRNEKRENEPELNFEFYFAPHSTAEDIAPIKELVDKADIFFPEAFNWNEGELLALQMIADGKVNLENNRQAFSHEHSYELAKIIYNTGKIIALADIPEGNEIASKIEQADRSKALMWLTNNLSEKISYIKDYLKSYAEAQREREEYIIRNLHKEIEKLLEKNPKLKDEKQLEILIQLGGAHTSVHHKIEKDNKAGRTFNELPHVFTLEEEGIRRYTFNKEVTDELAAKILLEQLMLRRTNGKDSTEEESRIRQLLSPLGYEDIEAIFTKDKNGQSWEEIINEYLANKK